MTKWHRRNKTLHQVHQQSSLVRSETYAYNYICIGTLFVIKKLTLEEVKKSFLSQFYESPIMRVKVSGNKTGYKFRFKLYRRKT